MRYREEEVNNINQKAGRVNDKYVDFISRKYTIHKLANSLKGVKTVLLEKLTVTKLVKKLPSSPPLHFIKD
jgi:hypothetical protein